MLEDTSFLHEMFVEAVLWRPEWPRVHIDELLKQPELARYFSGWGRSYDTAIIASALKGPSSSIGAGWFRKFSEREPGYGFVSSHIPELGIAVSPSLRGRGVGTAILQRLQELARTSGLPGLSLSVHRDNPARRLYERRGFDLVTTTETTLTMVWQARR